MSEVLIISLIVNLGLIALVLSIVYPRLRSSYIAKKKGREKRLETLVHKIVNDYLNELKND